MRVKKNRIYAAAHKYDHELEIRSTSDHNNTITNNTNTSSFPNALVRLFSPASRNTARNNAQTRTQEHMTGPGVDVENQVIVTDTTGHVTPLDGNGTGPNRNGMMNIPIPAPISIPVDRVGSAGGESGVGSGGGGDAEFISRDPSVTSLIISDGVLHASGVSRSPYGDDGPSWRVREISVTRRTPAHRNRTENEIETGNSSLGSG